MFSVYPLQKIMETVVIRFKDREGTLMLILFAFEGPFGQLFPRVEYLIDHIMISFSPLLY
jgi:hypothetical protein